MASHLLCFGHDEMLLKTRQWLLEKYVSVNLVREFSDLSALVRNQNCTVAVLCHTLEAAERDNALELMATTSPDMKLLCLIPLCAGPKASIPNHCILTESSAEALISMVTKVLAGPETSAQA